MATAGYGSTFERKSGELTKDLVGELLTMTPPNMTKDTIESTHFASADRYREFLSGLRDGGEADINCNLVGPDDGQAGMIADFDSNAANEYTIELADGTTFVFDAICTGVTPAVENEGKIEIGFSLKITGKPTITLAE